MKKFAKFMALLLTGVMLLSMTACCGAAYNEQVVRKTIVDEINKYRTENHLEKMVKEETECSAVEAVFMKRFSSADSVIVYHKDISQSDIEALDKAVQEKWTWKWNFGYGYGTDKDNNFDVLTAKYISAEAVSAQIREEQEKDGFLDPNVDTVGIGLVEIDGILYWECQLYAAKN